jgi:hypothetical protein
MMARIFKSAFTVRRSSLVLGALVGGLVFPAASMAITYQIKTTPIHKGNQGFLFTLWIKQGGRAPYGGRNPNLVEAILFKHNGSTTENDNYTFSSTKSHPLKFKQGANPQSLQFAKMTGTFANGRGSINLTFHASGPAHRVNVPNGCKGHGGERRSGKLGGSFTLHADKLGTITQKTFQKATVSSAAFVCNKPTHGYDVETADFGEPFVDIFKSSSNKVTETIEKEPNGNGWAFLYKYSVTGLPSTDYKIETTKNLKHAVVQGGGGITGGATYTSQSRKAQTRHTKGTLSGTLAATFGALGHVQAFPHARKATQSRS